jgi:CRISPR-associated protein Cmr5
MKKTTEQRRAKAAWEQVNSLKDNEIENFSTVADGAASLIQKVGFGQAMALWLSKKKKHKQLANFLAEWLLKDSHSNERAKGKKGEELMETLLEKSSTEYRRLTNEAIAYLNWIKQFAKARKKN